MFTMSDYLKNILAEAPSDFDGEDVTPAISELFFVNETHQKLDTATVDLFHRIVTRFLYETRQTKTRSGGITDHIAILRFSQIPCLRYNVFAHGKHV